MKPSPFTYHRPASRTEMLSLLQTLDNARLLAGGQSLMPMLNLRIASPDHLIDLNSVADLSDIDVADGHLRIGAMVRQRTLERSAVVGRHMPIFGEALRHIGFQQTRNRGTIGGSIAHMDPTAELPVVTLATDAMLVLESVRGQRAIAAEIFVDRLSDDADRTRRSIGAHRRSCLDGTSWMRFRGGDAARRKLRDRFRGCSC